MLWAGFCVLAPNLCVVKSVSRRRHVASAVEEGVDQHMNYVVLHRAVPMRDGVRLATDIYLPGETDGLQDDYPTLVIRTPYDKSGEKAQEIAEFFVRHDYACVVQDVRGRYESEGEFVPFSNEAEDGHDCLQWVGTQSWCNGRVGTVGTSYLAQTQASAAVTDPPHLTAQFISQGYGSYHRSRSRRGGAFENHRLNWLLRMAATSPEAARDPALASALGEMRENLLDWLREGYPLRAGLTPLARLPTYERALLDFMTRGEMSNFWRNPGLNLEPHYDEYADVPVTWLGSWYDGYALETPRNYAAVAARVESPQRLIMGPWIHGMGAEGRTSAGDVDFGPDAAIDPLQERRRWFDYTLKGVDDGVSSSAPVHLFIMGGGSGRRRADGRLDHGGRWVEEIQWPPAGMREVPHYLHRDGDLSEERPAAGEEPITYDFDPADPVPTPSAPGESIFSCGGGGFDQRMDPSTGAGETELPLSSRRDVVVFQSEPLLEDMEVTGPIEVVLYVSSSAVDTDFTAKLIDQYPPGADYPHGYALELTYTIQRCRYRNGYEREDMMVPGEVYQLRFPLPPTANLFAAGHRVRVDISSSNWPKYEVNPNTGEPVGRQRRSVIAANSIYCSEEYPSRIVLPVMSART